MTFYIPSLKQFPLVYILSAIKISFENSEKFALFAQPTVGNHLISLLAGQILWKKTEKKGKFFKNIESHRLGRPQSMIQLSAF